MAGLAEGAGERHQLDLQRLPEGGGGRLLHTSLAMPLRACWERMT